MGYAASWRQLTLPSQQRYRLYSRTTLLQSGHVILFFTASVTTDLSAPLSRSSMAIF